MIFFKYNIFWGAADSICKRIYTLLNLNRSNKIFSQLSVATVAIYSYIQAGIKLNNKLNITFITFSIYWDDCYLVTKGKFYDCYPRFNRVLKIPAVSLLYFLSSGVHNYMHIKSEYSFNNKKENKCSIIYFYFDYWGKIGVMFHRVCFIIYIVITVYHCQLDSHVTWFRQQVVCRIDQAAVKALNTYLINKHFFLKIDCLSSLIK